MNRKIQEKSFDELTKEAKAMYGELSDRDMAMLSFGRLQIQMQCEELLGADTTVDVETRIYGRRLPNNMIEVSRVENTKVKPSKSVIIEEDDTEGYWILTKSDGYRHNLLITENEAKQLYKGLQKMYEKV